MKRAQSFAPASFSRPSSMSFLPSSSRAASYTDFATGGSRIQRGEDKLDVVPRDFGFPFVVLWKRKI